MHSTNVRAHLKYCFQNLITNSYFYLKESNPFDLYKMTQLITSYDPCLVLYGRTILSSFNWGKGELAKISMKTI